MKIIILMLVIFTFVTPIHAKTFEKLNIPDNITCSGKELKLKGVGLRTATIFNVKVFVMAFYAPETITSHDDPNLEKRPMCFNAYYLRDIDHEKVDKGWEYIFKESSMHPYPTMSEDVAQIKKWFNDIKGERTINFVLGEEGLTTAYYNGKQVGDIKGPQFQKNFISLWFGKKPPTEKLQNGLMNK